MEEFSYGTDWNQVTYPGTGGYYLLNMDSFPYLADNPSPEATRTFLSYCGTTEAQVLFNEQKGSIPPRSDADVSHLNEFQQDQFADFTDADAQPPSIQHGLAVAPETRSAITAAFETFLDDGEPAATAENLVATVS